MRISALDNLDSGFPTIAIHCSNVVNKLIELYSDPTFCNKVPKFNFKGEFAEDEDGPKREV